jgi:hypothetical protein
MVRHLHLNGGKQRHLQLNGGKQPTGGPPAKQLRNCSQFGDKEDLRHICKIGQDKEHNSITVANKKSKMQS